MLEGGTEMQWMGQRTVAQRAVGVVRAVAVRCVGSGSVGMAYVESAFLRGCFCFRAVCAPREWHGFHRVALWREGKVVGVRAAGAERGEGFGGRAALAGKVGLCTSYGVGVSGGVRIMLWTVLSRLRYCGPFFGMHCGRRSNSNSDSAASSH